MRFLKSVENWLDIRPREIQKVTLCILGAFLLMAFVVLVRTIRETLFLDVFDVESLPFVTAAVACLSLPAVGLFAGLLGRFHPWTILKRISIVFCIGLGIIWTASRYIEVIAVVFYIWTAIGTVLFTSGFWVLVAESFAIGGAKRLFGLIAAGGTAGAMAMGLSMSWIAPKFQLIQLVPFLIGIILLLYLVEYWIYRLTHVDSEAERHDIGSGNNDSENAGRDAPAGIFNIQGNLGTILKSPYLRSMAAIVFVAAVASYIVDYQFKEFAEMNFSTEEMAGFLGSFYGWTGGIALAVQLLFTARIMGSARVALGLIVLPGLLLLGSTGFLVLPGLIVATLVRGGDYSLRKSLQRPMLEFLYVPVPALIRRKTKTFIDSFIDSAAEGTGAAVVFLWIVLSGMQSRYLSILVLLLSIFMIYLSRRMGNQYMNTIVSRLKEKDLGTDHARQTSELQSRPSSYKMDLLMASYSRLEIQSIFIDQKSLGQTGHEATPGLFVEHNIKQQDRRMESEPIDLPDMVSLLKSSKNDHIQQVLKKMGRWEAEQIPLIIKLLARDSLNKTVTQILVRIGSDAIKELSAVLLDKDADFVIQRRIPRILAGIGGEDAEKALLNALFASRFEIRYRAVVALVKLKRKSFHVPASQINTVIWDAIRNEVRCDRPVWEMRRLLDSFESSEDDKLIAKRVDARSNLSLEHIFRMLTLVLDPKPVIAALHGILSNNENFKSFALEYLEHSLPPDIKNGLWAFIGDASEARKRKEIRPLQKVVSDLMSSRATLFQNETDRDVLKKMLKNMKG